MAALVLGISGKQGRTHRGQAKVRLGGTCGDGGIGFIPFTDFLKPLFNDLACARREAAGFIGPKQLGFHGFNGVGVGLGQGGMIQIFHQPVKNGQLNILILGKDLLTQSHPAFPKGESANQGLGCGVGGLAAGGAKGIENPLHGRNGRGPIRGPVLALEGIGIDHGSNKIPCMGKALGMGNRIRGTQEADALLVTQKIPGPRRFHVRIAGSGAGEGNPGIPAVPTDHGKGIIGQTCHNPAPGLPIGIDMGIAVCVKKYGLPFLGKGMGQGEAVPGGQDHFACGRGPAQGHGPTLGQAQGNGLGKDIGHPVLEALAEGLPEKPALVLIPVKTGIIPEQGLADLGQFPEDELGQGGRAVTIGVKGVAYGCQFRGGQDAKDGILRGNEENPLVLQRRDMAHGNLARPVQFKEHGLENKGLGFIGQGDGIEQGTVQHIHHIPGLLGHAFDKGIGNGIPEAGRGNAGIGHEHGNTGPVRVLGGVGGGGQGQAIRVIRIQIRKKHGSPILAHGSGEGRIIPGDDLGQCVAFLGLGHGVFQKKTADRQKRIHHITGGQGRRFHDQTTMAGIIDQAQGGTARLGHRCGGHGPVPGKGKGGGKMINQDLVKGELGLGGRSKGRALGNT